MLVLSRKPGEKVRIGPEIFLTVIKIGPNTVRFGIEAPRELFILREELQVKDAGMAETHQDSHHAA